MCKTQVQRYIPNTYIQTGERRPRKFYYEARKAQSRWASKNNCLPSPQRNPTKRWIWGVRVLISRRNGILVRLWLKVWMSFGPLVDTATRLGNLQPLYEVLSQLHNTWWYYDFIPPYLLPALALCSLLLPARLRRLPSCRNYRKKIHWKAESRVIAQS